jgi:hypothetical protein
MAATTASSSLSDEDEDSAVSEISVALTSSSLSSDGENSASVMSERLGALCMSSSTKGDVGVTGTDDNGDEEGVEYRGRLRSSTFVSMLTRGRFGAWLDMAG